jgi:HAE1 family hydrophobic/amphiphilic exporter-1
MIFDQSKFINDSIKTVQRTIIEGALLAMLIIFIFLRNARSTLIIFTSIPLSIIATFVMMYFSKMTLNMISLGGIALGVGRMVDDSIVVLESIFRHRTQGEDPKEAAVVGATEVGKAVMAATFTTCAVFLPIVFVTGIAAIIFKPLALTVSFAVLSSLLVALTIIPLLSSRLLTRHMMVGYEAETAAQEQELKGVRRLMKRFGRWMDGLGAWYRGVVYWALSHRRRVVIVVTILMIGSIALVPVCGAEFMPTADEGQLSVTVEMDKGTILGSTDEVAQDVEKLIRSREEVDTVFTSVGASGNAFMDSGSGIDTATLMVVLKPKTERELSTTQMAEEIRKEVANIPGARISVTESSSMGDMGGGAPIAIKVKGDDLDALKDLSHQVEVIVRDTPGARRGRG